MFLDRDACMCLLCPYRSGRMGGGGGGGEGGGGYDINAKLIKLI